MPETGETNIEIASNFCERNGNKAPHSSHSEFLIEILEVIILAIVAVATAWSGYQAAQWNGYQAELYTEANNLNIKANGLITSAGQEAVYNSNMINVWLNAQMQGQEEVVNFYERRFLPEFQPAFDAWIRLDPINNSQAPPGPIYMPEYHNAKMEEANNLTEEASVKFDQGTKARATADDYIRNTVLLATALVLMAISRRFDIKSIRTGLVILSFGLMSLGVLSLLVLPRF